MLLIPAIDLRAGQCVRLRQGDFRAETRYPHTPLQLLQRYRALGAPWLHLVDLDGARDGARRNQHIIAALAAEPGVALQVGGGVRTRAAVLELLALGVQRVVIGSAAVERPDEVALWIRDFGATRICLALDVRHDAAGLPQLRTRGWRDAARCSLWDCIDRYRDCGLEHVLCTDIERDGLAGGPNLALYRSAAQRYPRLRWQASGGVTGVADLRSLAASGAAAAISGTALLEDRMASGDLQPYLRVA